jgi:D-aminopeptidase
VIKDGMAKEAGGLAVLPALSYAPQKARAIIRQAAKEAMALIGSIAPNRPEPPFYLRAEFNKESFAEERAKRPKVRRINAVTVEMMEAD